METNVIVAAFGGSKVVRTRALYQWDYGQVLQFSGLDLPDAYTVHFSNVGVGGTAKTMVGNADGVDIPDEYLTTGQTVYAWVYLHAGDADGETVYSVIIPVVARPKPVEDEPTPVQQGVVDQAIAALNAGVQDVQEAVEGVQDAIDTALAEAKASGEFDGADGVSPTVDVTEITGGHQVSVTDAEGAETFDVLNGEPGADGFSPIARVEQTATGATVTVTDKIGTTTANLTNGTDGVSPTITVTDITGGHRVSVTDAEGTKVFYVMNGATGETPNLQIGTVETLAPGSDATASMSGTAENPVLNLGLPQGGVDLGLTGATVGQIARITAVDSFGVPTAWEPTETYPKKVFEYTLASEGQDKRWTEVNVTAIDYESGILTVDSTDGIPFTDDPSTTVEIWPTPRVEGWRNKFVMGMMPPELFDTENQRASFMAILVGENQIKIYHIASNGTFTEISSYTDTGIIDLTRWRLFARLNILWRGDVVNYGVSGFQQGHRYKIIQVSPNGLRATINGFEFVEGGRTGAAYGQSYESVLPFLKDNNGTAMFQMAELNSYEILPRYTVSGYSSAYNSYRSELYKHFPVICEMDLKQVTDFTWMLSIKYTFAYIPKNFAANSAPRFLTAYSELYMNGTPKKHGMDFSLPGDRMMVWDMGNDF